MWDKAFWLKMAKFNNISFKKHICVRIFLSCNIVIL